MTSGRSDRPGAAERLAARTSTGQRAEELAVAHLQAAGLRIVARNWRRPEGELDIVADDAGTCVFVEVRSRTGDALGHPLESITAHKRARVIRTARLYLAELAEAPERAPAAAGYRFDVVGVTFDPDGRAAPVVEYLPNAFEVA